MSALLAAGCGAASVRFPRRAVMWVDDDSQPFSPRPERRFVPEYWDAADHSVLRPFAELWTLRTAEPAIDVNALDEVPDSSFFVNRIGAHAMSPERVALGACTEEDAVEPPGPWTIVGGKADGDSPGALIRDARGIRYVLKTDRAAQPEQSTAADALGAAIFHAAGYWAPCNRVVLFDPSVLVIEPGAAATGAGGRRPITDEDVRRLVAAAPLTPDGRRRAALSRFIEGVPLGPWDYVGTWDEDPNDVVPHEHRRELRGTALFDAWINHWDARQANTLSTWIATDAQSGYVRHYLIDFGDALGMLRGDGRQLARLGYAPYFDLGQIVEDTLSLGIVVRPWDGRTSHPVLGYFDVEHFEPEGWAPQYWNGALERRTEHDQAWAARILARFGDAHVHALVGLGRFADPAMASRLDEILRGRRDRLLERYLTRLSPLTDPVVTHDGSGSGRVCLEDLAVSSGIRSSAGRGYTAVLYRGDPQTGASVPVERAASARVCAVLRSDGWEPRTTDSDYVVLDVVATTPEDAPTGPVRLHFYVSREGRWELVGLQRPERASAP